MTARSNRSGPRIRQGKRSPLPFSMLSSPLPKQRLREVLLPDSAPLGTRLPGLGVNGGGFSVSAPDCHHTSLIGCPRQLISTKKLKKQRARTSRSSLSLSFSLFAFFMRAPPSPQVQIGLLPLSHGLQSRAGYGNRSTWPLSCKFTCLSLLVPCSVSDIDSAADSRQSASPSEVVK